MKISNLNPDTNYMLFSILNSIVTKHCSISRSKFTDTKVYIVQTDAIISADTLKNINADINGSLHNIYSVEIDYEYIYSSLDKTLTIKNFAAAGDDKQIDLGLSTAENMLSELEELIYNSGGRMSYYGYLHGENFSTELTRIETLVYWHIREKRPHNVVLLSFENWLRDEPVYPVPFDDDNR